MDKNTIKNSVKIDKINDDKISVIFLGDAIPVSRYRELRVATSVVEEKYSNFICCSSADTMDNIDYNNVNNIYQVFFERKVS